MTRGAVAARPGVRLRLRLFDRRHPEWWVPTVAAAAWVAIVVRAVTASPMADMPGMAGMPAHHDHGGIGGIALMTVAMMLPLVVVNAHDVAVASRWRRRHRAQAAFLAGYLAVWVPVAWVLALAVDVAVSGAVDVVGPVAGPDVVLVAVAAAAALWQFGLRKRRVLRWCGGTRVPVADGLRADRACARIGVSVALPCLGTCGGLMAVAAAAGHGPVVMAVLTAVAVRERTTRVYDPRVGAATIVAVAVFVLVAGPW